MGVESKEVRELFDEESPIEALLGRSGNTKKRNLPYPEGTVFKIFVGCLHDDAKRAEYEHLLTTSYNCQNILEKPGDLALITIDGTFDKDGCYQVVARYAIYLGKPEEQEAINKTTTDADETITDADKMIMGDEDISPLDYRKKNTLTDPNIPVKLSSIGSRRRM